DGKKDNGGQQENVGTKTTPRPDPNCDPRRSACPWLEPRDLGPMLHACSGVGRAVGVAGLPHAWPPAGLLVLRQRAGSLPLRLIERRLGAEPPRLGALARG